MHREWRFLPVSALIADRHAIAADLGASGSLFVRPDSPLKPFSGRVVDVATLSLAKLDHGFYYDDRQLPVVAAPVRAIGREWRFVVAGGAVLTAELLVAEGYIAAR